MTYSRLSLPFSVHSLKALLAVHSLKALLAVHPLKAPLTVHSLRRFAVHPHRAVHPLKALLALSLLLSVPGLAQSASTQALPAPSEISGADSAQLQIAGQLIKAGAINLAFDTLQRNPPKVATAAVWQAWAEQKWAILILQQDWQALKQDARGLPASFGAQANFAIPYEARALIELKEFSAARRLLQPAVTLTDITLRLQKDIRAQLISLYQAQGDYANAKIEAIRFHDEFKPQDTAWFVQRAEIEFLAGDSVGASRLLAPVSSIEAKLLQSLFRVDAGELDLADADTQIDRQLQRKRINEAQKKLAYGLHARLYTGAQDEAGRIRLIDALEQYLVIDAVDLHPGIVRYTADSLKSAYLDLSDLLINRALLDPTRSSLKFTLAQQSAKAGMQSRAHALYTDVMLDRNEQALQAAAKNAFVMSLIDNKQVELLARMLGEQGALGGFDLLDSSSSARILNYALAKGDIDLISAIAPFLDTAPANVDARDWILQKARIDIFAGRFEQGRDKIIEWLSQGDILTGALVDRVLQPVFDLQSVQQNEIALQLFDKISSQTNSKRHKREILFWKAQSYDALEQSNVAAEYFLRSAMVEANGFDQWGHSARYHAAIVLMEAGRYQDSRALFKQLLLVTEDATRRATIKQALQRLWLLEKSL